MSWFRCPSLRGSRLLLALAACAVVAIVPCGVAQASERADHHGDRHGEGDRGGPVFVSPSGTLSSAGDSCDTAAYSTIQSAVDVAPSGGTVIVCSGTYSEDVIVSTPLKLRGLDGATVQGSSTANGNCDQLGPSGPGSAPCLAGITIKSSWVQVSGFTVQGAIGEGILATGSLEGGAISDVVVRDNRVIGDDTGGIPAGTSSPYPQCNSVGEVPGDCGEGIHLMGAYDSQVSDNYVSGNTGGVLLTDEFGPTHDNLVVRNMIARNEFDCGVTAPGHNPFALDSKGNRQPAVAGVYHNVIADNWITDNGLKGEGAGVLFANATAGTASYDNLVIHNYIAGNSLAGVTLHAHPISAGQFEDLSGNRIIGNAIGGNNLGGDPDAGVKDTTGILVLAAVPLTVKIVHNRIFDDHFGIWLGTGSNVTARIKRNRFFNVDIPVFTQS
jgi:nitrous oxidase accessory protein NosD